MVERADARLGDVAAGVQDAAVPLRRRVPALEDDDDVARHLAEYFDGVAVPKLLDLGVELADHVPFGRSLEARVARRNIKRMAEQFIVGETPAEAVQGLHQLWRTGSAATVDLLGEKTIVEARPTGMPRGLPSC